jgi:hypothetical protein
MLGAALEAIDVLSLGNFVVMGGRRPPSQRPESWLAALCRCEESPALFGVPLESHCCETVNGLLDEQLVLADGAESP